MSITPVVPAPRDLDAEQQRDIERFERAVAQYLSGEISEDVFRVMRLNNGIYGQRQGGTNQMVRIKLPAGTITPEQLDLMGHLAETYSRGWGHITTRQNVQIHYVELTKVPEVMRAPRRSRPDHPRGLRRHRAQRDGLPPRRRLPARVPRRHRRGPRPRSSTSCATRSSQRLPRKFKINFSGCSTDCGQAMFNDVGVIAATRTLDDGSIETGFRVYIAGGLGANPHPALALEEFTSPRGPAADHRVGAAGLRPDRQPRQQAARPAEVGRRPARHRRGPPPSAEGAPHAAGLVVVAGRHPRDRRTRPATPRPDVRARSRPPPSARA